MSRLLFLLPLGAVLAALAGPAAATGRVEVVYDQPARFTDAGVGPIDLDRTQHALNQHFARLASRLPDGQVLRVQVRDVDLAGQVDLLSHDRVRIFGRPLDGPRLSLRYELSDGAKLLRAGDDELADISYRLRAGSAPHTDALPYERRLVEQWFVSRVAPVARTGMR
ncbi:MAG: DUF3016 domain-containing protein [Rubrivivax sp.]